MGRISCANCFSAVLFDGENEIDIGCAFVSSSTRFKNFQYSISHKIGFSPHQFSIFLVYRDGLMIRRTIQITSEFNLGSILVLDDAFFLVTLKRSKCERRRKSIDYKGDYRYSSAMVTPQRNRKSPPDNVRILRRNLVIDDHNQSFSGFNEPTVEQFGYDQRIQNLINLVINELSLIRHTSSSTVVCEECSKDSHSAINGGFHHCVNDLVVVGFRTIAGPIGRPE